MRVRRTHASSDCVGQATCPQRGCSARRPGAVAITGCRLHRFTPIVGTGGKAFRDDYHERAEPVKVMSRSFAGIAVIVCLATLTYACGSRATAPAPLPQPVPQPAEPPIAPPPAPEPVAPPPVEPPPPEVRSAECALIPDAGESIATVGLAERVDAANALHPSNESERLLFRQVFETLVRIDCEGAAASGLAASWRLDADGSWLVVIRDDARFADGSPVTAADVRAGWTRDGSADELRPHVRRFIESVSYAGEQ